MVPRPSCQALHRSSSPPDASAREPAPATSGARGPGALTLLEEAAAAAAAGRGPPLSGDLCGGGGISRVSGTKGVAVGSSVGGTGIFLGTGLAGFCRPHLALGGGASHSAAGLATLLSPNVSAAPASWIGFWY